MITRRNWLLRCSILINVIVLLYICSHVMIGSGNLALGPAFVIQEDYTLKQGPRGHAIAASLVQQDIADRSDRRLQQQESVQEVDLAQVSELVLILAKILWRKNMASNIQFSSSCHNSSYFLTSVNAQL